MEGTRLGVGPWASGAAAGTVRWLDSEPVPSRLHGRRRVSQHLVEIRGTALLSEGWGVDAQAGHLGTPLASTGSSGPDPGPVSGSPWLHAATVVTGSKPHISML